MTAIKYSCGYTYATVALCRCGSNVLYRWAKRINGTRGEGNSYRCERGHFVRRR